MSTPRPTVLALAGCLSAVALAACGGGGGGREDEARDAVTAFARATTEADGERLCGELFTRELMEQTTGATGEDAKQQCVRQIDAQQGTELVVKRITGIRVEGERATVTAEVELQGFPQRRTFRLEEEDGSFRLLGG